MSYGTTYYWKILAKDDYGTSASSEIWNFTIEVNDPPNTPSNPIPQDGASDVDINAGLSWACSDPEGDNITYDVYFGDYSPPPLVSSDQTESYYIPGTMEYSTKYYWRIAAEDSYGGSTVGPIWDFTTGAIPNDPPEIPSNPNPEDEETDVDPDADLSWTCIDPDGDDITYYVYFGDVTPPPLVASGHPDTNYDPGTLSYDTTDFWRINAEDENGALTDGPVWSYTTVDDTPPDIPVINGPQTGHPGKLYSYTFVSEEPNDDDIFYQINWGDGSFEDWFRSFESDEIVTKEYIWDTQGNFTIMC
jgi:hypothetical protein